MKGGAGKKITGGGSVRERFEIRGREKIVAVAPAWCFSSRRPVSRNYLCFCTLI